MRDFWTDEAACARYPDHTDYWHPYIFDEDGNEWIDDGTIWEAFGDTSSYYDEGRKICELCPVKEECLNYAMTTKQRIGMWGGKTPIERLRIERRERRARLKERRANENSGTDSITE